MKSTITITLEDVEADYIAMKLEADDSEISTAIMEKLLIGFKANLNGQTLQGYSETRDPSSDRRDDPNNECYGVERCK